MYISNTDVNSVDAAAFLAAMRYQTIRVNRIGYSQTFRFQTMAVTHYSGYAALSVTFLDMVGTPLTPVHGADYSIAFTGNPGPTGPTGPTGPALGWPALAPDGSGAEPSYSFASVPNSGLYRDAEGLLLKAGGGGGSGAVRVVPQTVNHGVRLQVRDHSQPGGPEWVDRIFINEASVALAGGATGVGLGAPGAALGAPVTRLSVQAGNNLGYNALFARDDNGSNPQVLWNNGNLPIESGTFTPQLFFGTFNPTSVSYTGRVGHYVRIGDLVFFHMNLGITAISGGSGAVIIGPLPFPSPTATVVPMRVINVSFPSGTINLIGTTTGAGNVSGSGFGVVPQAQRDNLSMVNLTSADIRVNSILTASGVYRL